MLLDKKHSPVVEYILVFYKQSKFNANLVRRVVLFYQGNNQNIIDSQVFSRWNCSCNSRIYLSLLPVSLGRKLPGHKL